MNQKFGVSSSLPSLFLETYFFKPPPFIIKVIVFGLLILSMILSNDNAKIYVHKNAIYNYL